MKYFLLLFPVFFALSVAAQPEKNNWYFGDRAAISFETGRAVIKYDNPQNIYGPSASVSHPVTGKLLLYTDGVTVWNGAHQKIAVLTGIPAGIGDVLIVADPAKFMQYFIIIATGNAIQYALLDMNLTGGSVIGLTTTTILDNQLSEFAVVYHPYRKAFWVISHAIGSTDFNASLMNEQAVIETHVVTSTGLIPQTYGDMVANGVGDKLVVTHYVGNDYNVEVLDFDNVCGLFSNAHTIPKEINWDRAYGAAFSPDDSKLYITFSYEQSQLIQYYGKDFRSNYNLASSLSNFNILRLGNDGKIYIATHDGGIPGPRIDAILEPNILAACKYYKTWLTTDDGAGRNANFELPTFASGKMFTSGRDEIYTVSGTCLGQKVHFAFNTEYVIDSLVWKFGDGTDSSSALDVYHTYAAAGSYPIVLTLYRCGKSFELNDTVIISSPPSLSFPPDTTVCYGTPVLLSAPQCDQYLWSTGEKGQAIQATKPGLYWLKAKNGNCETTDSIRVHYYPDIFTALGDEYTICDDNKELVKLDAGSEFTQYKWTPTGDTSQWIIVGNLGEYFVVVKDFRGCDGKDGTIVKRRCPVTVFYPNVFTPNSDGLNEVFLPVGKDVVSFEMSIYNAWGQRIFETYDLNKGWDGKVNGIPAPAGTYVYQSRYSGYHNKKLVEFEAKGNLTLLR